ncbi:DUF3592 domain-containing protein [Streptomyces sporangiiformans]|uniref:DUF3592 domain-containing protein n=1 Tax=Streptomyces sporangiiformans TaxID=2315329 RepID=A0A505D3Y1_9ACTN|nr:DUF3592 domain-containing protein [Streptomyces sporangiiformans]TPQ18394.1 hypothetical protein FGD71_031075 [Streptomyces sporangiiformans]
MEFFVLFLLLVPTLILALVVFSMVKMIGRTREVRRAWTSGLTAQARCLRTYTTTSGGGGNTSVTTRLHHVYEFMTWDGRVFRFDEVNGPSTRVEGDLAIVYYTAEHPERATAHAPSHGRLSVGTGLTMGCFGVIIAFCVAFIAIGLLVVAALAS